MNPLPEKSVSGHRRLRLAALCLIAAVIGLAAWKVTQLYLRFGPVGLCAQVPVAGRMAVNLFRPSDPDAGPKLGSQAHLACPQSPRSYMEWYALRVHAGKIFLDVLMETRGMDQDWGVTGFIVMDSATMRGVWSSFEVGEDAKWAAEGADVSMTTRGPDGPRRSFLRLLDRGPHAGSFEVETYAPNGKLHLLLAPVLPGMIPEIVGAERTRPGSWFQYQCVTMMGVVEGEVTLYPPGGPPKVYRLPASADEPAFAYLEHMWGQTDRTNLRNATRYYWDWGDYARPAEHSLIYFAQVDDFKDILTWAMACADEKSCFTFLNDRPTAYVRGVYSRLDNDGPYLVPQVLHIWAFQTGSPATINAQGFVRATYGDHQSFDLWGRAGDGVKEVDWTTRPVWSVNDFYKGAQIREVIPPPVRDLAAACGGDGCRVSFRVFTPPFPDVEYWVFRQKGGRTDPGEPVAVLTADTISAGSLSWQDPRGKPEFSYMVVPVRVPKTLLHDRFQAGYERTTAGAETQPGATAAPARLAGLLEGKGRAELPELTAMTRFSTRSGEVRPVRAQGGTLEFHCLRDGPGGGKIDRVLRPRFAPGIQVQSYYWTITRDNVVAVAWAERAPIMGTDRLTDWEVFVSEVDLATGSFRVFPVSMSDADDLDPAIETQYGARMTIRWQQCRGRECRPASQSLMTVDLR